MNESGSRISRTPDSNSVRPPASKQVTRAAPQPAARLGASCAAVVARCTVSVSADAKSYYRASITDDSAARDGGRFAPRAVITEWLTVSSSLAQWTLAGRITGYGPARFRYAAELAQECASIVESNAPDGSDTPAASETPAVGAPSVDVEALKLAVAQALRNLGIEARGASAPNASPNAVSQSIEELVTAVRKAQREVPSEVLSDAGLTAKVIETLISASQSALTEHTTSAGERTANSSATFRRNAMLGRLVREIRLLVASAKVSRKGDREIPLVRSRLLSSKYSKAKTDTRQPAQPVVTPATPVTPANTASPVTPR